MYRVDSCQCCGSRELDSYPAGIAPFIVEYVLDGKAESSRLFECKACGFRFYETRYTDAEAATLYGDYRGERYFRVRHRHEPWYTRAFNEGLGKTGGIEVRQNEIGAWIDRLRPSATTVLDYGGDRGQFLPVRPTLTRYVYDISGVEPEPGVTAFATRADLGRRTFDALVLSQVLEHGSEVGQILDHARALATRGAALVVEVPFEHFDLRLMGRSPRYQRYIDTVLRTPVVSRAFDFYSAACRLKLGVIPPLGFPRMHEHINYFSGQSLRAALDTRGFEVVSCSQETTSSGRVWLALARAR
jgi:hypothetical protein